ncbi:hypothetical protein RB195_004947 [Necator americanus]|uniref:Uncharacterized protein n=1 Tax=Necator americanus TaxID=51031 RepID=A0ABR1BM23_NECAM
MATPESPRKTARVGLRILFESVENGGVFEVGASRPGLVFEVRVSACEASKPALDSLDGSGALAQSAADVAAVALASIPPRHS